VHGICDTGRGVHGESASSQGVVGTSRTFQGVYGHSVENAGVVGESDKFDGVFAIAHLPERAAVSGHNDPGTAILGLSKTGRGVAGFTETWQGVYGHSVENAGVVGESDKFDGVFGIAHVPERAAVSGHNPNGVAGYFDGDVLVTRDVIVSGDLILQGADYAEALTTTDPDVVAGTVVVLGRDGQLHPCTKEYDSAVAGIVSGARGIKPAIVLDRHEDSVPVALMGKAWCWADASADSIQPGDLLTTSATPGHCRRATDPSRAFGAVIGKALTSLTTGRGAVRVLVSSR